MATTLIGRERTGDASLSAGKDGFTYTETYDYLVMSDDPFEDYWSVITTPGIPDVFITTTTSNLTCTSKSAARDSNHAGLWHVTCEFTQDTTGQDNNNKNPDPTTWIPIWTGTIETYEELLKTCKYSTTATGSLSGPATYTNSAYCLFPDPLMVKKPIVVFEFDQYEIPSLTADVFANRNDKINDAAFRGFGHRTLKINVKSFTYGTYFNYPAYRVRYSVAYKPDVWCDAPLDVGYEFLKSASDTKRVSSPTLVNLDDDGTKLADDVDPVVNWYYFPWEEIDFSSFIR